MIPQELKALTQWIIHKNKIPYNPGNPKVEAKANDPKTWGSYAKALVASKINGFNGIGFEFSAEDPFVGIDLDKCRDKDTGVIEPWALEIIQQIGSYTEISPSGTGVHILIKGKLPAGGNRKGKIEMYDQGRYFTMTGQHLPQTPLTICSRQAELEALHAKIFSKPQLKVVPPPPGSTLDITDQELLDKARSAANGDKFQSLWAGNYSAYASQSEADQALCNQLAFWCRNDPERINRLFQQSGLYRDKWNRDDYSSKTIQKAIAMTPETYMCKPNMNTATSTSPQVAPTISIPVESCSASLTPIWPEIINHSGAAAIFAKTYSNYLECPEPFLFMSYLTFLGHVISDKITLQSEIRPQPRLYVALVGESADARKSTSIMKTMDFFKDTLIPDDLNTILGVGSAEGLAKFFDKTGKGILVFDELKSLVQKCQIKGSVLLPCITTLFESRQFHSRTLKHEIKLDNVELCLLGASTLDTYRAMFTANFTDIGLINRLFVVIADSERKFSIPPLMPESEKESLRNDLRNVLEFVADLAENGKYAMPISSGARTIFDNWYFSQEDSIFNKRLDTYGHRLMPLLAANECKSEITPDIAEKVVSLLRYQKLVRSITDPISAHNQIAAIEQKIRRLLLNGPIRKRDLEKAGNKHKTGIKLWDYAITNLSNAGELIFDINSKVFKLIEN